MANRSDETWHRLREWTYGQPVSERLAAQILVHEGYENLDPSHPLGGKDGGKDATSRKDGYNWVMAVYFPKGQHSFKEIKAKFLVDYKGVAKNKAEAMAFITNQELTLGERESLRKLAKNTKLEIYHLERISIILDVPSMEGVRRQFLSIDSADKVLKDIKTEVAQMQKHLEATLTGGDAFCYCMLYHFDLLEGVAKQFVVVRKGDYSLHDVRFRIMDLGTNKDIVKKDWGEINSPADFLLLKWPLPDEVYYRIFFNARNGGWNQDLILRKSTSANCWLAATRVFSKDGYSIVFESIDNDFAAEFDNPSWRD